MKRIITDKIGEIEYEGKDVISFNQGLLGFEEYTEYILIKNAHNDLFFFLQSIEESNLMFILITPKMILPNYKLEIHESEISKFDQQHLVDFCIVTIPTKTKKSTMNTLGPIVIDMKNQLGKQVVSLDSEASTQYPLVLEGDSAGIAV